jgi:S-DNA-T family DNA segregation ATPase FtsK/SpoIIIE
VDVAATRKRSAGTGASRSGAAAPAKGSARSTAGRAPRAAAPAADRGPGVLRRAATGLGALLRDQRRDLWGILLLLTAVITGLGVYLDAAGPVGAGLDWFARGAFGFAGYLVPVALLALGVLLAIDRPAPEVGRVVLGVSLAGLAALAGAHLVAELPAPSDGMEALADGGGLVGWLVATPLDAALSRPGAWAVVVALGLLGVLIAARLELRAIGAFPLRVVRAGGGQLRELLAARPATDDPEDVTTLADAHGLGAAQLGEPPATSLDVPLDEPDAEDATEASPRAAVTRAVVDAWLEDADATTELPAIGAPDASTERIDVDAVRAALEADDVAGARTNGGAAADVDPAASRPARARKVLPPGQERPYELPPLDLLSSGRASGGDPSRAIAVQTKALQETFDQFGINATVARSSRGPTVTRFEVELGPGVKVNKVANLGDDIAYALAAPDVRIVAPIPGKSAIGIEVPNVHRDLIALGDVLRSDVAQRDPHPLSVALGVDIAGVPAMVDLSTMPHLLVSGSTGSGKSVTLNGMIASILMRARPDQVRMLLIDPKRVELGVYEGAPHLLAPVVTDPRRAADAVAWCVKEMEQRYELLALLGFRNIDGYNDAYDRGDLMDRPGPDGSSIPPKRLPYILLVIDELADLMLVAPRDVEDAICRIAQMARAVGIHMVIATQRPSVDVITGLIKANIPSRLALAVASQIDSRTILDAGGAEKLVGRGDMLFLPASQGKPSRMQGCWVTEEEIAAVVSYCRTQREPVFEEAVAVTAAGGASRGLGDGLRADDEGDAGLVRRAAEQVVASGLGSTSMLQRKLRVGFARAGRLMDELEQVGCVGPSEGSKAREVLWDQAQLDAALEAGLI